MVSGCVLWVWLQDVGVSLYRAGCNRRGGTIRGASEGHYKAFQNWSVLVVHVYQTSGAGGRPRL